MTKRYIAVSLAALGMMLGLATMAQAATDYPSGYTKCAQVGSACSMSGTHSVALGKSGSFVYATLTGNFTCTQSLFPSNSFTSSAWCSVGAAASSSSSPTASSSSSKASSSSSSKASSSVSSVSSSSSVASSTASAATMKVSGGKLYDANGKQFIVRGVNLQYGDWPADKIQSISPIASTGANTIRLELRSNTTATELQTALDAIVAKKMVAMVMYWESDVTCVSGTSGFATAMTRWTSTWKSVLTNSKYQKYLLLNIANEWGSSSDLTTYRNTYVNAIKSLRSAGYKMPIVVDAPDCGQNYSALASSAGTIMAADSLGNSMLSVHAYWSYQTSAKISAAMTSMNGTGYAWLWGEFPSNEFQKSIGQNTDHPSLMKLANSQGVGYLAWSWRGNGGDTLILDMSNSDSAASLTSWGKEVVETSYGIRANSKLVTY